MGACLGLTQGEDKSEYNIIPIFFLLSFLFYSFVNWLASDVRMRIDVYHKIFVRKIPIFL